MLEATLFLFSPADGDGPRGVEPVDGPLAGACTGYPTAEHKVAEGTSILQIAGSLRALPLSSETPNCSARSPPSS